MGTYARYYGKGIISTEKRDEFTSNLLKVLNYGGMVQLDKVNMYGKEITLLKPVELNDKGKAYFDYNYFEDDVWETAGYNANDTSFYSEKIGSDEFSEVIIAIYFLYELYDKETGVTSVNGSIVRDTYYVSWLNQVLGTNYSMKNRFSLWEQYELYCMKLMEWHYKWPDQFDGPMFFLPTELRWAAGGVDFSDVCYLRYGTANLIKDEIQEGSYSESVYRCKEFLKQYFGENEVEYEQKKNELWDLICSDRVVREETQGELQLLATLSLELYARVFVYLTCERLELNFWEEWKELKDKVYNDAIIPPYASEEVICERNNAIHSAIVPMRTEEFLRIDGPFTFWDTPKELEKKPRYFISGDDRAYWWDGTDEVVFSDEMEKWLEQLSAQHKQIVSELEEQKDEQEDMLKMMLQVLQEADDYYKRIFAYQSMFYEFLQNGKDIKYIAAFRLFAKLVEENKEEGKYINDIRGWGTTSRQVTFNIGRLRLKRFLAVMANESLRKKYFEF